MIAGLLAAWLVSSALAVRAQDQFVLVDETYTATAQNTSDSHYRVNPRAGTPANWRAPIDYAGGKVHARLDVESKPSAKLTLYNICFEATPSYACMPYGRYTSTGVVDFEYPFSAFYQNDMVDWSKGVRQIALILKDEGEKKMQGSPDFYPTTVHVTLTVVRAGATYVPPAAGVDAGMPQDAGVADAGGPPPEPDPRPVADAGREPPVRTDAAVAMPKPPVTPSAGASGAAGTSAAATAGAPPVMMPPTAPQAMPPPAANGTGQPPARTASEPASSCASSARRSGTADGAWLLVLGASLLVVVRARAKARKKV